MWAFAFFLWSCSGPSGTGSAPASDRKARHACGAPDNIINQYNVKANVIGTGSLRQTLACAADEKLGVVGRGARRSPAANDECGEAGATLGGRLDEEADAISRAARGLGTELPDGAVAELVGLARTLVGVGASAGLSPRGHGRAAGDCGPLSIRTGQRCFFPSVASAGLQRARASARPQRGRAVDSS